MEKEATDLKSRQPLHTLYRALDLEIVFCSLICIREMKSKYTVQSPHIRGRAFNKVLQHLVTVVAVPYRQLK